MKWIKGLKRFGVLGGALVLTVASVFVAVLLVWGIQVLARTGFQAGMFLVAILIALALSGPLSYVVMVSLLELDDAVYDLARKESQVDYLVQTVLEKDESEKDQLLKDSKSFAQNVAHDLKTPLTAILGFASMLSDSRARIPPEQQKVALQAIVRTSLNMNNIIQELLLLAAVRQANIKTGPVQMGGIVGATRQRLWSVIADANAELIVPDASSWPVVVGYAPWIEEVWINYLSNAIKYGGKPARIELGADAEYKTFPNGRKLARFWVRDNGKGISPEDQAQLFNQFTRLDQVRAEGHGLGLSIVAQVIEKLGGEVGVESQLEQGSTFYFLLPMMYTEPVTRARQQTNWFREKNQKE
jgi:signal transduction histidine kinase